MKFQKIDILYIKLNELKLIYPDLSVLTTNAAAIHCPILVKKRKCRRENSLYTYSSILFSTGEYKRRDQRPVFLNRSSPENATVPKEVASGFARNTNK